MVKILLRVCVNVLIGALLTSTYAAAGPTVIVTTEALGLGEFEYDLLIDNSGSPAVIAGLFMFNANTTFGLDFFSTITAPTGWGFLPPISPAGDQLSFFSFSSATDIPIGGMLGGFSFDSFTDPSTLSSSDYSFDFVDSSGHDVPEPSSLFLAGSGLLTCLGFACRCCKQTMG